MCPEAPGESAKAWRNRPAVAVRDSRCEWKLQPANLVYGRVLILVVALGAKQTERGVITDSVIERQIGIGAPGILRLVIIPHDRDREWHAVICPPEQC